MNLDFYYISVVHLDSIFFVFVQNEIQLSLPFFWEERNYRETMWRWWLSITECHGIVEKGCMVCEICRPGHYHCKVEYSITHLSWYWSFGCLRPPPSWQHNLIYSAEMEITRRKTLLPSLAKMVAIYLYIIKPIPFPNWTLPLCHTEWCCSSRNA